MTAFRVPSSFKAGHARKVAGASGGNMFVAVWTKTRRCGGACSDGTRTRRQIILSDARACLRERGGTHGAASVSSSGVSHLQHTPHCSDNQYKWQGLFALYQPTSFPLARPHSLLPVNASKRGRRPVLRGESNPREWRSCGFGALARVSAKSLGQKLAEPKLHQPSATIDPRARTHAPQRANAALRLVLLRRLQPRRANLARQASFSGSSTLAFVRSICSGGRRR